MAILGSSLSSRSCASILAAVLLLMLFWAAAPRKAVDLSRLTNPSGSAAAAGSQANPNPNPKSQDGVAQINPNVLHADVSKSDRVAVIIESRPLSNLIPIILHFSAVLGPSWPIVLYYIDDKPPTSPAMRRAIASGALTIRQLPEDVEFDSHTSVSSFFITPWLWERLAPAKHVLIFQADSVLCSNSHRKVDDFFAWDLIGAPIEAKYGVGYNGGLSLRNRELMLRVTKERGADEKPPFEDQWFYKKLKELADKGEEVNLPGPEEAAKFSVETVWADRPLGYHQISRWHPERMDEVKEWCPEIGMAIGGSLHPGHQ